MEPTDPNTGVPLYDPCHMYTGDDYSACFANGGHLPDPAVITHWYDQSWVPALLILQLVLLVAIVGSYVVYRARKTK